MSVRHDDEPPDERGEVAEQPRAVLGFRSLGPLFRMRAQLGAQPVTVDPGEGVLRVAGREASYGDAIAVEVDARGLPARRAGQENAIAVRLGVRQAVHHDHPVSRREPGDLGSDFVRRRRGQHAWRPCAPLAVHRTSA